MPINENHDENLNSQDSALPSESAETKLPVEDANPLPDTASEPADSADSASQPEPPAKKQPFGIRVKNFFKTVPKICIGFWIAAGIALILHILSSFIPAFADFMVRYPNSVWRWVAAKLTMWIPFSLAEMLIILIPLILISLLAIGIYVTVRGNNRQYVRLISILLSVLSFFYTAFVFTLAPGYKTPTLDVKLDLARKPVSAEELYDTGIWLNDQIQPLLDELLFYPGGASVMPYSLDEMNRKLNDAYKIAAGKYDFISSLRSNIKYVVLSEPMSYTHITGVYTYFTGEANLNINFPDYTLPYTAAHEFAHQRGIAREDEANFVAFLTSVESEDPYILYSAYVNMLEYVMSALASADKEQYATLYRQLDSRVTGEFNAYAEFYEKYRENVAANVSGVINDSYLQSQGVTVGSKSYGLVVDLTVAYYHRYVENAG